MAEDETQVVIEHVDVAQLPEAWRAKLAAATHTQGAATVTIRIEAESAGVEATLAPDDSLFGMWRDRDDMADVAGYIRAIRAPRFTNSGTAAEG